MDMCQFSRLVSAIILGVSCSAGAHLCAFHLRERTPLPFNTRGFINVDIAGSADIHSPFVQVFVEGERDYIQDSMNSKSSHVRPYTPGFLETVVLRTNLSKALPKDFGKAVEKLVTNVQIESLSDMDFDPKKLRTNIRTALRRLYGRYRTQGPERRNHIGTFKKEDVDAAQRTTHFLTSINGEQLAHIQVQSSQDFFFEPLNFETHFPDSITRRRNEPAFEIGRLELTKESELSQETRDIMQRMGIDRRLLLMRTLQKVTTWLNHDLYANNVHFQINDQVMTILRRALHPVELPPALAVRTSDNAPTEWVIKISSDKLLKIEEMLLKKIIKHSLATDIEIMKRHPNHEGLSWHWTFWPNEFSGLQRISAGKLAIQNRDLDDFSNALTTLFFCGGVGCYPHDNVTFSSDSMRWAMNVRDSFMLSLDYWYALRLSEEALQ